MEATTIQGTEPTDYRELMRKVEGVVDVLDCNAESDTATIHRVTEEILRRLRDDLGFYRGRLYVRDGDDYLLRTTFPEARPADVELRVPGTYPPIELCLLMGTVFMGPEDPRVDPEIEALLHVQDFAAIEVGDGDYLLGFSVAPGHDRDDILSSLAVVRRALNETLRRQRVDSLLRQAQQIHASILPGGAPEMPPYSIWGRTRPVDRVGGDLYDYIPISDKILGVAIADASGHGLPAALQVRDVHVGLRMGAARDFKMVRTVERLNTILHRSSLSSRFVTLFYGELEANGNFIYVNAGHPPGFHLARDGEAEPLVHGGPVLGPLSVASYERGIVRLRRGEMIVLYTDGITEALRGGDSTRNEEYGYERLVEVAHAHRGREAPEVVDAIFEDVERWTANTPLQDDRTVVVIVHPELA